MSLSHMQEYMYAITLAASWLRYLGVCLLMVGLPAGVAHAQPQSVELPVDPMPFFPERTGELAATSQLPAAYELFVPDTSIQILFNPARAMRAASSWSWVTYNRAPEQLYQNPYGSDAYDAQQTDDHALAGTWLRRQQRSAWLLQAGLRVATQQGDSEQHSEYDVHQPSTRLARQQLIQEGFLRRWEARLRLARSWDDQQGGSHALEAFGFVGTVDQKNQATNHVQEVRRILGNGEGVYRETTENHNVRESEATRIVFGVGYSRATARSDWIATLSYQQATNQRANEDADLHTSTDSLFDAQGALLRVQESLTRAMTSIRSSMEPRHIVASGYARYRMGWLQADDHLFVSAIGLGGWGKRTDQLDVDHLQRTREAGVSQTEDSTRVQGANQDDLWSWNAQVGVGYVITVNRQAVTLVSGPSLWGEYGRAANMDVISGPQIRLRDEECTFHGSVVWPVYVHYRASDAVRLFGGLTYAYGVGRLETSRHLQQIEANRTQDVHIDQVTKRGSLMRSIFLGAVIALPSGLAAQFAFNGNLATYANWTVSLGWRY